MPASRVVVVGSSNMDLVCRVPALPRPGETVGGGAFATHPGGKGANQAVAAARTGARVVFVTRLGDDAHGRALRDILQRESITLRPDTPDPDTPTGTALILVDEHAENMIAVAPGANHRLGPGDLDAAEPDIASAMVLLCQMEVPDDTVAAALARARRHGVTTVLNYAPTTDAPARVIGPAVSLLVVNETEAGFLAGAAVDDAAALERGVAAILGMGVGAVVVTLGERGALYASAGRRVDVPGVPVEPVDTTGAGDTFCGALCARLAAGMDIEPALRYACAAGALATTAAGAQSAIPTRAQVDRFLADGP